MIYKTLEILNFFFNNLRDTLLYTKQNNKIDVIPRSPFNPLTAGAAYLQVFIFY